MKSLSDFIITLVFLGFLFYLIFYIVMDFPHPQWLIEQSKEIKSQLQ